MKPSKTTFLLVNLLYLTVVILIIIESLTFTEQGGLVPLVVGIPILGVLLLTVGGQLFPGLLKRRVSARKNPEEVSLDVVSAGSLKGKVTNMSGMEGQFSLDCKFVPRQEP